MKIPTEKEFLRETLREYGEWRLKRARTKNERELIRGLYL